MRVTTIAVPTVLVGLLTTGVAVAVWPAAQPLSVQPAAAQPPTVASGSTYPQAELVERVSRLRTNSRPPIAGTATKKPAIKAEQAEQPDKVKKSEKSDQAEKGDKANKSDRAEKAPTTRQPSAAQLRVTGYRYNRVPLNVRSQPRESATLITVLRAGSRLPVTATTEGAWTLIRHDGTGRWVHSAYLAATKPVLKRAEEPAAKAVDSTAKTERDTAEEATRSQTPKASGSLSGAACPSGSAMEFGLTSDAIGVHRAVCDRFPQVKSYGGVRADSSSFHSSGRAVDVMVSSSSLGWDIANWVRANSRRLGVSEVIFSRRIWTVQRSSDGWRSMSDRGSPSANHYDHVHVSVYGNAASG